MSERPAYFNAEYNNAADIYTPELQCGVNAACDALDDILNLPQTRSLLYSRAHSEGDSYPRLEIDRHFIYDDAYVTTSASVHYEMVQLGEVETYTVSVAKTGRFPDERPSAVFTVVYELRRVGARALDGSVTSEIRIDATDDSVLPIRPTKRPIMIGDLREISDVCDEIVLDANAE